MQSLTNAFESSSLPFSKEKSSSNMKFITFGNLTPGDYKNNFGEIEKVTIIPFIPFLSK